MISLQNSRKITILSFVLFIGVMLIHTFNLDIYQLKESNGFVVLFEKYTNNIANEVCVPYFFTISGFLFFRNFDMSLLLKKYKSRCFSILFPYILWNTLYYIFFVSITRIPFLFRFMNSEQLAFGIREYIDYVWHGYYTLWFLRTLIWMIICAPLIYLLLKRRKYYWPEVVLIILIILKIKGINILFFDIYYIMGAYLGLNCTNLLNKNNKKIAAIAFICFLGVLVVGDICFSNLIYTCLFIATSWLALDLFTLSKDAKWCLKNYMPPVWKALNGGRL